MSHTDVASVTDSFLLLLHSMLLHCCIKLNQASSDLLSDSTTVGEAGQEGEERGAGWG